MRRPSAIFAASFLLLLLLTGCLAFRLPGSSAAGPLLSFVPFTPEGEARRNGCGFSQPAHNFRLHATHRVSDGVLVFYSATCPDDPDGGQSAPMLFVAHVRRMEGPGGLIAYEIRGSSGHEDRKPSPDEPITYGVDAGHDYVMVYGRVLKPRVSTVEALFDDGRRLKSNASGGVFSLLARNAADVCELRALGADGQELKRLAHEDLEIFSMLPAGESPPRAGACPR